ncbi:MULTISPECIES: hypothetical protein [Streptomyces]|uniref:DNA-binding protein n=2 Tax=Streptomyces TaxID=1883 RepID=A0A1E7LJN3_9ACTN|nr:hypothetical protein [Streptomyces nanshensis]OEV16376.1 hypothetical protein AN221_32770 [Streptomyces nanshensis]
MTAKATAAPPTTQNRTQDELDDLIRYTPDEVIANRWLPYKSARVLKEKCYRREVIHHNDGGRISFTAEDIRRENERTAVLPAAA